MQDDSYTEIPDWLKNLQGPPPEDVFEEPPPEPSQLEPAEPDEPADQVEPPEGEGSFSTGGTLLDSLREQAITEEEMDRMEERQKPRGGLAGAILAFAPWQRFVLSLLIFAVVTLLGMMCLVMTGRIVP